MSLLKDINNYYTQKIEDFGCSPQGVDWKDEDGQFLRFKQLSKIFDLPSNFSVNDIGCGYGSFVDFLETKFPNQFRYYGFDISEAMIEKAKTLHPTDSNISFSVSSSPLNAADYSIASGIFNVRLNYSDGQWMNYIYESLNDMNLKSSKGFSFNCLTSYSDQDKKRPDLFYADPCILFDHCKKNYSKNVSLIHDYNLYEFTILVRKS